MSRSAAMRVVTISRFTEPRPVSPPPHPAACLPANPAQSPSSSWPSPPRSQRRNRNNSPKRLRAADVDTVLAGHSYHGEAFNEGPRQAAVLIPGMGSIEFPTSSKSATAQRFIEQGVLQLHGFWYLEAERSFRQAATEDPELAIPYWGMAMANTNNQKRARGFIDEAMTRRDKGANRPAKSCTSKH